MFKFLKKFRSNEEGATAIEYGLIAALISIVLVATLTSVGGSLNALFTEVSTTLDESITDPTPPA